MNVIKLTTIYTCLMLSIFSSCSGNQFATHIIITCIDDSEPSLSQGEIDQQGKLFKLGAISSTLYMALLEEQCAIIVCSSLMHFLTRYLTEVSDNPFDLQPKKTINPKNWIPVKIDNYLYLLIPHKYAASIPSYTTLTSKNFLNPTYTPEELALGLKFKNKEVISSQNFLNPLTYKQYATYPTFEFEEITSTQGSNWIGTITEKIPSSWISHHFIKHFVIRAPLIFTHKTVALVNHGRSTILITNEEYRELFPKLSETELNKIIPQPIILAEGHGSPYSSLQQKIEELEMAQIRNNILESEFTKKLDHLKKLYTQGKKSYRGGNIAGFNPKDFGTFTHFLAYNTATKLLFFNTCFGNEVNIQEALHDIEGEAAVELSNTVFPFPIITGAMTNSTAISETQVLESANVDLDTGEKFDIKKYFTKPIFKKFFDTLNTSASPSHDLLLQALDFIYSISPKNNNIPFIKEGTRPWQPLLPAKKFFSITPEFVQKQKTPIDLSQQMTLPDMILVEAYDIPTPFIINNSTIPFIFSSIPGDAVHTFAEIQAPQVTADVFFKSFFPLQDLKETKAFIIKKLTVLDKSNKPTILNNVMIVNYMPPQGHSKKLVYVNGKLHSYALQKDQKTVVLTELVDQSLLYAIKSDLAQFPKTFLRPQPKTSVLPLQPIDSNLPSKSKDSVLPVQPKASSVSLEILGSALKSLKS